MSKGWGGLRNTAQGKQTQVSRSTLNQIKEKENLSSLKDFAFNPKYTWSALDSVCLSCYPGSWSYQPCFYVFTLCVMVQESVQTLSMCPSQQRSVTMYYLCWKEFVHRNDLSSNPISSPAVNQSTELVDFNRLKSELLFPALCLPLGEQWMVLFSSQSAQGECFDLRVYHPRVQGVSRHQTPFASWL